ncbi:hypothetical protein DUF2922 [Thermacetogenium phaeum DSM 12270]|uniref:DUF2922 domain-containing protein n=2 Tax=Thermacetogenium phaeum TaxID=85874 RepID=K4LTP9_THEPS|nr:DUF2922 domain-containing protein [Thermacetogenium phaeum]AFV11419.1 hypothetical protein DUF2922 [Thermacetogenium phaeum DSM 12270]KUK36287.1 MAG: Uncharacterized protein XD66_1010 [Thermacetogenium phaeum]MDN5376440.1 hypothetical protein [Thermacetogenium sp.]
MISKTLELIFTTAGGGRLRLSVPDPRLDLTAEQVSAAMSTIAAKNIFTSGTGGIAGILSARIVTRETTDLISVS